MCVGDAGLFWAYLILKPHPVFFDCKEGLQRCENASVSKEKVTAWTKKTRTVGEGRTARDNEAEEREREASR